MNTYAFILGRKPLLSLAELLQVVGEENIDETSVDAVIANLQEPLAHPQAALNQLGGTIKIAEVFAKLAINEVNSIAPKISEHMVEKFKDRTSKINYGISVYSLTQRNDVFLKKTLNFIKKELVKAELKSRFINNNFKNPENAAIKGEKLLEEGAEIVVIQTRNAFYLGETIALQDFEGYSKRDYDRPARDAYLGMLPPKLAQIMINLSGVHHLEDSSKEHNKLTIYDPFCGIGTVLTEGLSMGFNVLGSDIDLQVIEKSKKNISYILATNGTSSENPKTTQWRVFTKDATKLSKKDIPENVDAIVTESYLGPPVSQFPLPQNMEKTFEHIRKTIFEFMRALYPALKPGTPVVISLLLYRRSDRFFFVENLVERIAQIGYKVHDLIPPEFAQNNNIKSFRRQGLVYDRPDQIVGREIWKFTKK